MKFVYLLLGLCSFIGIVILFFQMIAGAPVVQIVMFSDYVDIKIFVLYCILLGILTGMFLTLAISGFIS
jgi:uncharacterized membrane protein (DUF106 family)